MDKENEFEKRVSRRKFFNIAGWTGFCTFLGSSGAAGARFFIPRSFMSQPAHLMQENTRIIPHLQGMNRWWLTRGGRRARGYGLQETGKVSMRRLLSAPISDAPQIGFLLRCVLSAHVMAAILIQTVRW